MLSSGHAILYQKGKRYVQRAIFYLNKGQVYQDLKEGSLTYLLITPLFMLILYYYLHFFPFYIIVLDQSIEYLVEGFLEELKLVLDLDEVFENS
jgi:hypothetical protein